jgi:hypothetical protein
MVKLTFTVRKSYERFTEKKLFRSNLVPGTFE